MPKLWLARFGKSLVPTDAESERFIRKLEPGECAVFEATRPRSVPWHRMYFGICRTIGQNMDPPRDESSIDLELRIHSGHFEVYVMDGHEIRVPKSIRFADMTADEWAEYWKTVETVIVERFGEGYIREAQWT